MEESNVIFNGSVSFFFIIKIKQSVWIATSDKDGEVNQVNIFEDRIAEFEGFIKKHSLGLYVSIQRTEKKVTLNLARIKESKNEIQDFLEHNPRGLYQALIDCIQSSDIDRVQTRVGLYMKDNSG